MDKIKIYHVSYLRFEVYFPSFQTEPDHTLYEAIYCIRIRKRNIL